MAARAYWRGYLRLSLVAFPVQLFSALEARRDVELHQIHKPSGERVRHAKMVPDVGPVAAKDIVMGYEYEDGRYVLLEEEDLDEVRLETSDTIELEQFIDAADLDDIYVDKPFYIMPTDKAGCEAYRVLRTALKETGKIAIGEVVLHRRERIIAVRPRGCGLMLETLRYAEELREAERYFGELDPGQPDPRLVALTCDLIEQKSAAFDPKRYKDDYEAALRQLIQAKLRGQARQRKAAKAPPAKVVDLMQALRRSIEAASLPSANANEPQARAGRTAQGGSGHGRHAHHGV